VRVLSSSSSADEILPAELDTAVAVDGAWPGKLGIGRRSDCWMPVTGPAPAAAGAIVIVVKPAAPAATCAFEDLGDSGDLEDFDDFFFYQSANANDRLPVSRVVSPDYRSVISNHRSISGPELTTTVIGRKKPNVFRESRG